jgi:ABC-type nitrate/sulfonate/bicarbonate transport system ATPase subunit
MGIEIVGISKRFMRMGEGGVAEAFVALNDFNLKIRDNEFVSLIGPSGCGKTTMVRIIDGLTPPDSGKVEIDGKPVTGPGPDRGVVFQNFALMPWATVLSNVSFPLEIRGVPRLEREAISRRCIEIVGLKGFEHVYPHALSGGMQQRAGLARALAVEPRILLMDEPFGAVDAQTRHLLQEELIAIWEKQHKTVVFVTHSMEEAVLLSDRVVIMEPRPGRVAEVLDVPIPRPRHADTVRRSSAFVDLSNYVWERLRQIIIDCQNRPGCAE